MNSKRCVQPTCKPKLSRTNIATQCMWGAILYPSYSRKRKRKKTILTASLRSLRIHQCRDSSIHQLLSWRLHRSTICRKRLKRSQEYQLCLKSLEQALSLQHLQSNLERVSRSLQLPRRSHASLKSQRSCLELRLLRPSKCKSTKIQMISKSNHHHRLLKVRRLQTTVANDTCTHHPSSRK